MPQVAVEVSFATANGWAGARLLQCLKGEAYRDNRSTEPSCSLDGFQNKGADQVTSYSVRTAGSCPLWSTTLRSSTFTLVVEASLRFFSDGIEPTMCQDGAVCLVLHGWWISSVTTRNKRQAKIAVVSDAPIHQLRSGTVHQLFEDTRQALSRTVLETVVKAVVLHKYNGVQIVVAALWVFLGAPGLSFLQDQQCFACRTSGRGVEFASSSLSESRQVHHGFSRSKTTPS